MLKFISVFFLLINYQIITCYKAALVEYLWDVEAYKKLSPFDLANKNAKNYDEIVENIKRTHKELDIVVFPEDTLVLGPRNTPEGRRGMTVVPKAEENIVPCNSTGNYASFLKLLSCTAQKYKTYLVINLKEIDSDKFYNTDVVFDRTGKVIARYRKFHLFLEPDTNTPTKPELITFDTDFGKTFGIFTCFDMVFKSPPLDLVRNGVENFIFPTLWIPELPFFTTIQALQMWAHGNNVALLASSGALPAEAYGAVGIFLGNKGVVGKYVGPRDDNYYLYHDVPEKQEFSPTCELKIDDDMAEKMDKFNVLVEDLSGYAYKRLDTKTSKSIEEKLCQKDVCCNFKINTNVSEKRGEFFYEYFLLARSGNKTYGETYKNVINVCGLVACAGNSTNKCGKRFSNYSSISWPITFEKIEISANFENIDTKIQYPNTLLADFSPIPPHCTTWKTEMDNSTIKRTFSTNIPVKKLLTYSIHGRDFSSDDK